MCAITGIIGKNRKVSPIWIKKITDILRHRGPDDEGYLGINTLQNTTCSFISKDSKIKGIDIISNTKEYNAFLGHRRLSVIDVSSNGHQPMISNDSGLAIVFNGEIYNYIELRNELILHGFTFNSNSDTEVILKSYEFWGYECTSKFNGMWAFVIYDKRKNLLFGSRDRFGIKPLYYYNDKDFFSFASEIKALTNLPFYKKDINKEAVYDYIIINRLEIKEESFFKNIYELKPANNFIYNLNENTFHIDRYYILSENTDYEKFNQKKFSEYLDNTKKLIYDAIKIRLRSDVSIGSCLSGGIDSSSIVCLINDIMKKEYNTQIGDKQKVFTACFESSDIDESKWAKLVADKTKTEWYKVYPQGQALFQDIEDLVYYQDIPFNSTSIYAQYNVMKKVSETGVKVILDGQGGDELFTGYTPHYLRHYKDMAFHFDLLSIKNEISNISNSPINISFLIKYLSRDFINSIIPKGLKNIVNKNRKVEEKYLNQSFYESFISSKNKKIYKENNLNGLLREQFTSFGIKSLLKYEDRNSMRFSIEARTPFADDINLIEYVFRIPANYKIHNGFSKYLLRESVKDLIPQEIYKRTDKKGFSTPENCWIKENKNTIIENYFTNDLNNYLNIDKIKSDWDKIIINEPETGITNLWRIINFAIWKKVYEL